jgi:hypothetical protein
MLDLPKLLKFRISQMTKLSLVLPACNYLKICKVNFDISSEALRLALIYVQVVASLPTKACSFDWHYLHWQRQFKITHFLGMTCPVSTVCIWSVNSRQYTGIQFFLFTWVLNFPCDGHAHWTKTKAWWAPTRTWSA